MPKAVTITAWYLNLQRCSDLLGSNFLSRIPNGGTQLGIVQPDSSAAIFRASVKEGIEKWIASSKTKSLGQLLTTGELQPGVYFTTFHDFYCRGLRKYSDPEAQLPRDAIAELHTNLGETDKQLRLQVLYHPAGLLTMSAWGRLSGRARLFVFGYVESVGAKGIIARPLLVGDLNLLFAGEVSNPWDHLSYGEIQPDRIDQFSVKSKALSISSLDNLRDVPEREIKKAFAEIVSEPDPPKDWGGEQSDLFTTNVQIAGMRVASAFMFKGPSHFKPLTPSGLGKNGDQIFRLFSEPADLLILQHCHKVEPSVRATMRAFASQISNLRQFCVIDGYDTIRILSAYGKCGLKI